LSRRSLFLALLALAGLTWLRVALVDHLPDQGFFEKYLVIARTLPRERLAEVSPAYLWLMVLLRGVGPHAIRTMQIIGVSIAALAAAMAAGRLGGRTAAFAAAIFILGSRATLVCATDLEPEILIVLLDSFALVALARERWFAGGALLGLAATGRPVALLVAAAIGAWLLLRRELRDAAAFAIAVSLPVMLAITGNFIITGDASLMDPGCAFYEGMNPSSEGYAGVQPRIVKEIEGAVQQPDYVHVAYRIVASRAAGRTLTHRESNAWWTAKAVAFMREYPENAARIAARKLLFAFHAYDRWDLSTMARKSRALERWPVWIPFPLMAALAGVALLRRRREATIPLLFAAASMTVLVLFFVSGRQREAVIPALAVAAAIGVSELVSVLRTSRLEAALMIAGIVIIATLLSVDGPAQREDLYTWGLLHDDEAMAFDRARELGRHGDWAAADALFDALQRAGYQPLREASAVPSVAWYRARAALHLRRDPRPQLAVAAAAAPGDVHVLALQAVLGDRAAMRRANALHDPFTAEMALAEAWSDAGNERNARLLADDVRRRIPEWTPAGAS